MKKKKDLPKKDAKETQKTKKDLIGDIKKHKKSIQEIRFNLSGGAQQKGKEYKKLRREIARSATKLTALSKQKKAVNKGID